MFNKKNKGGLSHQIVRYFWTNKKFLTPVLSAAASLRADLDCDDGVLVPIKGNSWDENCSEDILHSCCMYSSIVYTLYDCNSVQLINGKIL